MLESFYLVSLLLLGEVPREQAPLTPAVPPPPSQLALPEVGGPALNKPDAEAESTTKKSDSAAESSDISVILPTSLFQPGSSNAPPGEGEGAFGPAEEVTAPLLPSLRRRPAEFAGLSSAAAPSERRFFMKALQGTAPGAFLDDNRLFMTGWMNASVNGSSAANNNGPVTWNDRPNNILFQQGWIRLGRSLATSGTTEPSWGFQLDFLIGSDYRYTLPRGLWNSQLLNSSWDPATDPYGTNYQNIYGVDLVQQYLSYYVPNLFRGTEFRVGRFYTPWGMESVEAPSTPLISRSYAFEWCPPFTHCGVAAYTTFDSEWTAVLMAVNGNDIYWGDPATEWRFVGNVKWTQSGGGKNTVTLATSLGRGKFNPNDTFLVPGYATINEPGGRSNFNAFDVVWTHLINPRLAYDLEAIYGYQTNVPGILNEQGYGTAHWYAIAHYLFWTVDPKLTVILRYENFQDLQGQRTGTDALYTSFTSGFAYKISNDVILRSEVRYDIANRGLPFDNGTSNQILLGAIDLTVRW